MKISYGIILLLSIISVSCKGKKYDDPKFSDLMITCNQQLLNQSESNKKRIPPPRVADYALNNLIVDSSGNVYFYHWLAGFFCGTENDAPPYFIGIEPKNVYRVPAKSLDEFLKMNLLYFNNRAVITIAVPADSFRHPIILRINKFLYENYNRGDSSVDYGIRRISEEESVVLKYKKSGELFYFPEEIKWDTSKIRLPDNFYRKSYRKDILPVEN